MDWRNRKVRIAIVLAIAVMVAFVAWRTGQVDPGAQKCESGRIEEKDASGKVVRITRRACREG